MTDATTISTTMKTSRRSSNNDKGMSQRQEKVAMVFQRDAAEVRMMIKAFLADGSRVIAITKRVDPPMEAFLLEHKHVTIKIIDTTSHRALSKAIRGADRAVLETKYWEQFASAEEEEQAIVLIESCHVAGVSNCLFNTVENTKLLRDKGLSSQVVVDAQGRVHPTFDGMEHTKKRALQLDVHLTHMITSYADTDISRRSLCLITGENGKVISVPFYGTSSNTISSGDETDTSSVCSMSSDEGLVSVQGRFLKDASPSGGVVGKLKLSKVDIHWMLGIGFGAFLLFFADPWSLGRDAFLNNSFLF